MSRFNTSEQQNRTTNFAGGEAFEQSPRLALVSLLLTSFVKNTFYRSSDETIKGLSELMDKIPDKRFAAKAAIYARTKYGMRSVSHVVAGEIAQKVKGEKWTKNFFDKIVYRPDDMTEILAYYYAQGHKNEPNALKKGFAQALTRFDAYQLAKYKKDGQQVSLIDVANLVHPRNTEAISQLIKGTLPTPKTWETQMSAAGKSENVEEAKTEVWKELLTTRKLGYFALLRNLRNIIEQAPELVPQAMEMLTDDALIEKSLVLPFRYTTAIEEIAKLNAKGTREIMGAIALAIDKATKNAPVFDGDTLVVLDGSGSMSGKPLEIGALFAAVLYKRSNADFMMFSNSADYHSFNPLDSTITTAQRMAMTAPGGGTNFHAVFEEANKKYDRIIFLSDMQGWIGYDAPTKSLAEYNSRIGANPKIYSFDLAGNGTLQFPEPNIFCLAGFSEKVFDIMKMLETDKSALVNEIEKIEL